MKRLSYISIGFCLLLLLLGVVAYRWLYPYGKRTCFLPCVMTSLQVYAAEHGGEFPKGMIRFLRWRGFIPLTILGAVTCLQA